MQPGIFAAGAIIGSATLAGCGAHATPPGLPPISDSFPPSLIFSCGTEIERWGFNPPAGFLHPVSADSPQMVDVTHVLHHAGFMEIDSATITPGYRPCGASLCGDLVAMRKDPPPADDATPGPQIQARYEFTGGADGSYATGMTFAYGHPLVYYGVTPDGGDAHFGTVFRFTGYETGLGPHVVVFSLTPGPGARPTSIATDRIGRLYVSGPIGTIRLLEQPAGGGIFFRVDPGFSGFDEPPPPPIQNPRPPLTFAAGNGMRAVIGSRLSGLAEATPPAPAANARPARPRSLRPNQDTVHASDVFGCHDSVVSYYLKKL